MHRRTALELIAAALATSLASPGARPAPKVDERARTLTIDIGGRVRTAYAWFGGAPKASNSSPLGIGFHGGAGNAAGYIAGGDDRLPGQALKSTPDAVGMALEFFSQNMRA